MESDRLFGMLSGVGALRRGWERTQSRHGCAGADGISLARFSEGIEERLTALSSELRAASYRPLPLRLLLVEKHVGSPEARRLWVPAVRDRAVQGALLEALEPLLDPTFEECSYAYRKGHSVRDAVLKVHYYHSQGYRWLVDADLDSFFDSVEHAVLWQRLAKLIPPESPAGRLLSAFLAGPLWDGEAVRVLEKGLPQGSSLSPLLANLVLDSFDEALLAHHLKLVRYADDFVILCRSRPAAFQALEMAKEALAPLHLTMDTDKTQVRSFDEGVRFLGVIFLKDLLLAPYRTAPRQLKVLFAAPLLCETARGARTGGECTA